MDKTIKSSSSPHSNESVCLDTQNQKLLIGIFGRSIGIDGSLRLFIYSDFPQVLKKGREFLSSSLQYPTLHIRSCVFPKALLDSHISESTHTKEFAKIAFEEITTKEQAQILTNHKLYSTLAQSKEQCELGDGEFFWCEIIGCEVVEDSLLLGEVSDIERIGDIDYLCVKSCVPNAPKSFLLPYTQRYIITTDIQDKRIEVRYGLDILRSS